MGMSREEAYIQAKEALKKAQERYDKAYTAWQDELDGIVLKPMHVRNLSRKQAMQLARAISDDTIFTKIMEMGLLPEGLRKGKDITDEDN